MVLLRLCFTLRLTSVTTRRSAGISGVAKISAPSRAWVSIRNLTQAVVSSNSRPFNLRDLTTWHTPTVPLPDDWSCDWSHWDNSKACHDGYMSTKSMRQMFGITGDVVPLAFLSEIICPEPTFVFFAGGTYYWFMYGAVWRYEGPFSGHDDLLGRLGDNEIWDDGIEVVPLLGPY
ncbi:hypothetical protein MVEN_01594700 [Mycena venus]|uniref:Uncharacterized protein n=1 Tax=Mycena venus TaxID=2733690 RepID=A0A8H7CPV0_9AGAR|nr:hypothetical protein MVEN_01594700 [Mycena venus]